MKALSISLALLSGTGAALGFLLWIAYRMPPEALGRVTSRGKR